MYTALIEAWLEREPWRCQALALLDDVALEVFLVGGTVRDALLGRECNDLDLAVRGEAMPLARRMADALRGAYVVLDEMRDMSRIVLRRGGAVQHIDVAALRAPDIIGDLRARDFSVNAMALPLTQAPRELLDPTGGVADLRARLLRATSPRAFEDDPLRILRGFRLSAALGFRLSDETVAWMRQAAPGLEQVSTERIRDELIQILATVDATQALKQAENLGILALLFPESAAGGDPGADRLATLAELERLLRPASEDEPFQTIHLALPTPFRAPLIAHWQEELSSARPRWVALKLAALLAAMGIAEQATTIARRLRLSAREVRFVEQCLNGYLQALTWAQAGAAQITPLALHRYYRAARDAGVDAPLLARSVMAAQRASDAQLERLDALAERLWAAWFLQQDTIVDPPLLLSGTEVMRELGIAAGPQLGALLQRLREAQVQGLATSHDQALAYLQNPASDPVEGDSRCAS